MCGWVLSYRSIGPFPLTNGRCRNCSFWCISLICWAYFSDVMVLPGFRKLWWIRWQQTTKQWPWSFYWWKFDFRKCFGASSWSNHWAGYYQLLSCKIHFLLHITIWLRNGSLLLCRIREDDAYKMIFFYFQSTHLLNFFTFSVCFKCLMTVNDWCWVFINFSCSCKRVSFDDLLSWSLSTSKGQPLCSSSSRLLSPLSNFLNNCCIVCSLWRKLSAKELMLLNCGVGEDSWESFGLQGDLASPL